MIRIGIIGAGLIGRERLLAVKKLAEKGKPIKIAGIYDANSELCQKSASEFGVPGFSNLDELLAIKPDWIVVSLPHDAAVQAARSALKSGASVLLEKPMGRDLHEAYQLMQEGRDQLRIGLNYRFYPGFAGLCKTLARVNSGKSIRLKSYWGTVKGRGKRKHGSSMRSEREEDA